MKDNLLVFKGDDGETVIPLFWCDYNVTKNVFFRQLPKEYQDHITYLLSEDDISPSNGIYEVWHRLDMLDVI